MDEKFGCRHIVLDVQRHEQRAHALRNEAIAETCRSITSSTRSAAVTCMSALAHTMTKHRAVLDGEHEHRTGLGLARAEPAALAASVARADRARNLLASAGRWAEALAVQIVTTTEALLSQMSGLHRREAKALRRENRGADKS